MNPFEKIKNEVSTMQSEIFGPILALLESAQEDADKYYSKGNRSAGNRLKKKAQEIRKAIKHPEIKAKMASIQNNAKELRSSIMEEQKAAASK